MNWRRFNVLRRIQSWKQNITNAVVGTQVELSALRNEMYLLRSSRSDLPPPELPSDSGEQAALKLHVERVVRAIMMDEASARECLGQQVLEAITEQEVLRADLRSEGDDIRQGLLIQSRALDKQASELRDARAERQVLELDLQSVIARQSRAEQQIESLVVQNESNAKFQDLSDQLARYRAESANVFRAMAIAQGGVGELVGRAPFLYLNCRDTTAVITAAQLEEDSLCSHDVDDIVSRIVSGQISRLAVTAYPPADGTPRMHMADDLLSLFADMPTFASSVFVPFREPADPPNAEELYRSELSALAVNPHVIDAVAARHSVLTGAAPAPFDKPDQLPRLVPAVPKRRSALFLHNNYYHFNCLSDALRKRGWDTMTVSVEDPASPQQQYYHGEDLNLFDPDYSVLRENVRAFFKAAPERFGTVHFYGAGQASLFAEHHESSAHPQKLPWDFFELRRHQIKIGYMPTGCLDGARQSDIRRITNGLCSSCVWERQPNVCSDAMALAWADRLESVCDWIGLEADWVVGRRTGEKYVRGPVVTTLNTTAWSPDLEVPEDMKLPRRRDEVLIYHAVGNYDTRRKGKRDIKGTGAVMEAIETLQAEGLPVRLIFFSDVPSTKVKYYQLQADIVVDQLRYGRYGANARECLMLGKPVVGWIDGRQADTQEELRVLSECPIVRANVDTITDVLRDLVRDAGKRARIGRRSREFAVRWHGAEACAERYEQVIDRVQNGLPPDSPDLYPPENTSPERDETETMGSVEAIRRGRVAVAELPSNRAPKDRAGGD